MDDLSLADLKGTEKLLAETIKVNCEALDNIVRTCTKAGLARVCLAAASYPDRPKYNLAEPEELECYSLLQDIQNAHFKLFGVKGAIYQIEEEKSSEEK